VVLKLCSEKEWESILLLLAAASGGLEDGCKAVPTPYFEEEIVACTQPDPVTEVDSNTPHSQGTSNTPRGTRPSGAVVPGAMAVDGPGIENYNDDYTVTAPSEVAGTPNDSNGAYYCQDCVEQ